MRIHPAFVQAVAAATESDRLELVLRLADGSPWRLTLSRGMERFIGYYPRVDGIDSGEPLLRFAAVRAA